MAEIATSVDRRHPAACDTPMAEFYCAVPNGSLRQARMNGSGPEFFHTPTGGVRYLYAALDAWLAALPKSTTGKKRKNLKDEGQEQVAA